MKKILCLLFCLVVVNCNAQFTNSYWRVGRRCAIDFRNLPPIINLNDSNKYSSIDNCSANIEDRNGNTIFYSNGLRVFNRNGHVMPNGSGIDSGFYSTTYATSGSFHYLRELFLFPSLMTQINFTYFI